MEGGGSGPPDRASLLSVCGPGSPPSFILIFHTNNSCCPLSLRGDNDKVPVTDEKHPIGHERGSSRSKGTGNTFLASAAQALGTCDRPRAPLRQRRGHLASAPTGKRLTPAWGRRARSLRLRRDGSATPAPTVAAVPSTSFLTHPPTHDLFARGTSVPASWSCSGATGGWKEEAAGHRTERACPPPVALAPLRHLFQPPTPTTAVVRCPQEGIAIKCSPKSTD